MTLSGSIVFGSDRGLMPTTSTAKIANDSPFREAYAAMNKIVERLSAMAGEGATADDVTRLLASDGPAMLRDFM